jgi:hypothetical protein
MRAVALCLLLSTACPPSSTSVSPAAAPAPVPSDAGSSEWTTAQEACVDRWLAARALDAYGSPQGTMYMGGTPLFDEASGKRTSRQAFLAAHQPEALRSCGLAP